jgi:hypothetical protein
LETAVWAARGLGVWGRVVPTTWTSALLIGRLWEMPPYGREMDGSGWWWGRRMGSRLGDMVGGVAVEACGRRMCSRRWEWGHGEGGWLASLGTWEHGEGG